ncbi:MAG: alpha-galactosidase [Phycisphaerales bacterium]
MPLAADSLTNATERIRSRPWIAPFAVGAVSIFVTSSMAQPAAPTPEDLALRDRWVSEHFPIGSSGFTGKDRAAPAPEPSLRVLASNGPVLPNDVPGKGLSIADRPFKHGLYCHAPTRIRAQLPGPARAFAATVGVLTNPDSQGGSVVFEVTRGGRMAYRSPVMHRGEAGVEAQIELDGAQEFILTVGDAGDGITSDQAVWGEATVTMNDGTIIRLSDLPLRDASAADRSDPTPPFSFIYDDVASDLVLPSWAFGERAPTKVGPKTTRGRTYTDPRTGLLLCATIVTYADFPTVEWTLTLKNTSDKDTPIISCVRTLDTQLEYEGGSDPVLHHIKGDSCTPDSYEPLAELASRGFSRQFTPQGGRPTNGDFPYWNVAGATGGLIASIGWPGQWSASFSRETSKGIRVHAGQELTHFRLHPGEEVRTPLAVLQFYRGDWIRGQNIWRRWMVAHNLPRPGGQLVPTHYAGCWSDDLQPRAETEMEIIDGFARENIALDYWIIDAGWYPDQGQWPITGTWEVDHAQFPRGIREVSDHARKNGMKFVLWFEPERCAGGTWLTRNHPEWVIGGSSGGLVNLGNHEAWSWVVDRVDGLITSEGVDAYRQDFNIDPLGYWRSVDSEDRQGITETAHVAGYLAYWDELLRRHPAMWIDSCASGGRRNDLETMRRSVPLLRSDYFADPEGQQGHTYGLALWLPYYGSGLGVSDEYWFRSCIFPASRVGCDTRKPDQDYPLVRRMLGEFRRVQPYLMGDYYPLTPYSLAKTDWLAWQFDSPERNGGFVQAFRREQCDAESMVLKLRGLDPAADYAVENMDDSTTMMQSGRNLLERGLTVSIPNQRGSALRVYHKVERPTR